MDSRACGPARGDRRPAGARRRAGDHRKTDAAALGGPDEGLHGRRGEAHRGCTARHRLRHGPRRDQNGDRPHARRHGRGFADPHPRLGGPRLLLRRGRLRGGHGRRHPGILLALRGRRHRVRTPLGTPVQLQQSAGGLPPVRGVRQGDRHRREPRDPRQEQDHLRGRRGLLARRDDAQMETEARGERLEIRLSDPYAVPRTDARAETPAVARQPVFSRTRRIFRIHRLGTAQNPVPGDESPLHGQDHVSRMRRFAPAQRGAVRPCGRQNDRGPREDARGRADRLLRRAGAGRTRCQNGVAHPRRDPQPPAIPRGRGAGLSDARPAVIDPLGRRESAHQPLDIAGQQPHGVALHPRRTLDRAASARHQPPDRRVETAARPGQHGDRRGARGRGDPRGGLDRGHRSQSGLQRRRGGFQRHAAAAAEKQEKPHGRLPHGAARNSRSDDRTRVEQLDNRQRRPGKQPAQHRREDSAGRDDLHHGRQRLGKVVAGKGHSLPGAAAHAVRHGRQTGRFRRTGRRRAASEIGRDGRSEPHRQVVALESGDLYKSL